MSKKILYLHIGWSKTGTSAVQEQLDKQFDILKRKGILYSKDMQMNDNAHHHFALAYNGIHGYPPKYNVQQVHEALDKELESNSCDSLILSSELSPFYFNNPLFCDWVKRFDEVKILATVRRQSEVLISLFNQLIKDPQVRYKGTFFQLAISNFPKMNYFQHIQRWAEKVGDENIHIINYENGVVEEFLSYFDLKVSEQEQGKVVNPSLPNSVLRLLQSKTDKINTPDEYRRIRDNLINDSELFEEKPQVLFLTKGELRAIDQHFEWPNNVLSKRFLNKDNLFSSKDYNDIYEYEVR